LRWRRRGRADAQLMPNGLVEKRGDVVVATDLLLGVT
jgi:hypothetical protein